MTNEETNQSISRLIKIAISNQPNYIYDQLLKRKMVGLYIPSGNELESKMYDLYIHNRSDFFSILSGVDYDPTVTNYSTSPETKDYLNLLAQSLGVDIGNINARSLADEPKKKWWETVVGVIAGQSSGSTSPSTSTTTTANVGAIIGLVLVAALVVAVAYFAFFKSN